MRLLVAFIAAFIFFQSPAYAVGTIPPELEPYCEIVAGSTPIAVGSPCNYPGYPADTQSKIVCDTGSSGQIGFSSSICCDTQDQCNNLGTTGNTGVSAVCDFSGNIQCVDCMENGGAWTAIGCIPASPGEFIGKFLGLGAGLAGGIAFLLIILGGFRILTSTGNPEQLNAGKELVTSAITGLLLIVFSVFILRIIGYNILSIPGFG